MRRPNAAARTRAVGEAIAASERKHLRAFEHQVDVKLRLHRGEITHGLKWTEDTSRLTHPPCGCGRAGGRRWIGTWQEHDVVGDMAAGAICSTGPLCAPCTSKRQIAEQLIPNCRSANWRESAAT